MAVDGTTMRFLKILDKVTCFSPINADVASPMKEPRIPVTKEHGSAEMNASTVDRNEKIGKI